MLVPVENPKRYSVSSSACVTAGISNPTNRPIKASFGGMHVPRNEPPWVTRLPVVGG